MLGINEFQEYLSFYPTNPRADYAQYQLGIAHHKQMRAPERDQTETREAIKEFNGSLHPINLAKLLWRLKIAGVGSTRVPLMGVKKKFRNHPLMGAGLAMMAIDHLRANGKRLGKTSAELGWILEDNKATNNIIRSVGGVHYKTHRLYEKAL